MAEIWMSKQPKYRTVRDLVRLWPTFPDCAEAVLGDRSKGYMPRDWGLRSRIPPEHIAAFVRAARQIDPSVDEKLVAQVIEGEWA